MLKKPKQLMKRLIVSNIQPNIWPKNTTHPPKNFKMFPVFMTCQPIGCFILHQKRLQKYVRMMWRHVIGMNIIFSKCHETYQGNWNAQSYKKFRKAEKVYLIAKNKRMKENKQNENKTDKFLN